MGTSRSDGDAPSGGDAGSTATRPSRGTPVVAASLRKDAPAAPLPFRTVLVANRGEIAVRIMRACRELGLRTVVVYSDADRDAGHVRVADVGVRIGPPAPTESYLDIDAILAA